MAACKGDVLLGDRQDGFLGLSIIEQVGVLIFCYIILLTIHFVIMARFVGTIIVY